jgi:penicillin-binding protein 1A
LILGGLTTGVTPLEMAHAYTTLSAGGQRLSGTMAANSGGPVGINKVTDGDGFGEGDLVPDQTGANGENKVVAKQVIAPETAETTKDILSTVITSGTGKRAATTKTLWGKTGTTDDNGDAWFCGATEEITACVWVGHADTVTPMLTEFAGAPVDGGTIPALIFADVVNAYTELEAARKEGEDIDPDATDTTVTPTTPAPTEAVPAPAVEEEVAPVPEETAPAPEQDAGAAPDTGGGAVAPTAGGVTPG